MSSKRAKTEMDQMTYEKQKDSILESVENPDDPNHNPIGEFDTFDTVETMNATYHMLDGTSQFMINYLASKIEQKIIKCKTFHCNSCKSVFEENEKVESIDSFFPSWKPCCSSVDICRTAEQFFKLYDGHNTKPRYDFKVLYCLIFRAMNFDTIYPKSKFECDRTHKYQFIKCVVGQYITIRANQISKQITLDRQDRIIRQQYRRLVNFKGQ